MFTLILPSLWQRLHPISLLHFVAPHLFPAFVCVSTPPPIPKDRGAVGPPARGPPEGGLPRPLPGGRRPRGHRTGPMKGRGRVKASTWVARRGGNARVAKQRIDSLPIPSKYTLYYFTQCFSIRRPSNILMWCCAHVNLLLHLTKNSQYFFTSCSSPKVSVTALPRRVIISGFQKVSNSYLQAYKSLNQSGLF